jgi:hypothetical protein
VQQAKQKNDGEKKKQQSQHSVDIALYAKNISLLPGVTDWTRKGGGGFRVKK